MRLLKASVATLHTQIGPKENQTAQATRAGTTWVTVVKKDRSHSRRRAYSNVSPNPEARAASNKAISNKRAKKPLILVPRKRRVRGTLKVCSASTVRKVILQVAKLPEEATLQVKRKFKTAGEDKRVVRWWHVISGDEEVLSLLDRNWENVEVHGK